MQILTYVFEWLYFSQCLTSFSSMDYLPLYPRFLILFHLTYIDEILLINPSANVFVWDFSIHHKDWLNYSSGTDRPGELCYNFPISIDLTQTVNFLTRIPDSNSHGPALLDIFLFSDAIICSVIAFLLLGNSHHIVVLVSIDFSSNSQQDAQFHLIAYDYFCADWNSLCNHLRDAPWDYIFKFSACAIASDMCWVGSGWNWCIYPSS